MNKRWKQNKPNPAMSRRVSGPVHEDTCTPLTNAFAALGRARFETGSSHDEDIR